jgi:histidine ammonia-lyase
VSILSVGRPADLDRAAILAVAAGSRIELGATLREEIGRQRRRVVEALADGRAVYGVTTGMGAQSGTTLTAEEQRAHQNRLLLARAVGGAPWLRPEQVRALYAVRLRTFLSGDAGVSIELVEQLIRFLDADVLAAVPSNGYGSAGEIISLAHAFGPLTGIGSVLDGAAVAPAGECLQQRGLPALSLGVKEGIALLQGIPGATALAVLMTVKARRLVDQTLTVLAAGVVAIGGNRDPYRPGIARGDADLAELLAVLRDRLGPEGPAPRELQAPVSFRVGGIVLAQLTRSVLAVEAAIDRALTGVTDSPAFLDAEFVGTAGFHGIELASALDALSVAMVHAAEVSSARIHRLLDPRVTGLASQLAGRPGPDAGLVAVHKRAAGTAHQLRRAALSSVIGSIETSFGQEDVQSFSWEAAINAETAWAGVTDVLAGELFVAAQALVLSGREPGPRVGSALAAVAKVVAPIVGDRIFGPEIDAVRELLLADEL